MQSFQELDSLSESIAYRKAKVTRIHRLQLTFRVQNITIFRKTPSSYQLCNLLKLWEVAKKREAPLAVGPSPLMRAPLPPLMRRARRRHGQPALPPLPRRAAPSQWCVVRAATAIDVAREREKGMSVMPMRDAALLLLCCVLRERRGGTRVGFLLDCDGLHIGLAGWGAGKGYAWGGLDE